MFLEGISVFWQNVEVFVGNRVTVLFAQHEEQVSSAVFELSVQVCHQSDQTIPQSLPLLRFSAGIS